MHLYNCYVMYKNRGCRMKLQQEGKDKWEDLI